MTLREWLEAHPDSVIDTTNYGRVPSSELLSNCEAPFMDKPIETYTRPGGLDAITVPQKDANHVWQERARNGNRTYPPTPQNSLERYPL